MTPASHAACAGTDEVARTPLASLWRAFFSCRICWRVTGITFLTILVVEAVILIPSYWNYERDRLLSLGEIGRTAARGMLVAAGADADGLGLEAAAGAWIDRSGIVGARLVRPDGEPLSLGEPVSLDEAAVPLHRIDGGTRYEAGWHIDDGGGQDWLVLVRMQAEQVGRDLRAFVLRIVGLVLLIACAVTTATMVVLSQTVLRPVLKLREAMCLAALSPEDAEKRALPVTRGDEVADMTMAFNDLAKNTSRNLREIRATADALAEARVAAERANAAKSSFLASMSHELRTPLNAILGFSDMLKGEMLGPLGSVKYRGYAEDIHASGTHLLALINDILDLSKAEAGRIDLHEDWTSLPETAKAAVRMLEERAAGKGVRLETDIAALDVYVDGSRFRQVLLNLLSNAVKFTPRGGTVVLMADRQGGELAVRVRDTGVGIPANDIETLFEPFAQARNHTAATASESTGLGLAISRRLIEMHDGSLTLSSVVGEGTTATVLLPRARARSTNVAG